MDRLILGVVFGLVMCLSASSTHAQHKNGDHAPGKDAKEMALPNCPVMDEPINLALSIPTNEGPVYFCCEGCIPKFQKDPAKYATKVAAQRKALAHRAKVQVTCPVTNEPVDKKIFVESKGEKIFVCCKACVGKYQSDPAKYAAALANSYTFQTKCPVMGGDIDPKVFSKLSTGETIYYCCPGCDKTLRENPAKYNKSLVSQGIVINWAKVKKATSEDRHDHGSHDHGDHDH